MSKAFRSAIKSLGKFLVYTAAAVGGTIVADPAFGDKIISLGWRGVIAPVAVGVVKATVTYISTLKNAPDWATQLLGKLEPATVDRLVAIVQDASITKDMKVLRIAREIDIGNPQAQQFINLIESVYGRYKK